MGCNGCPMSPTSDRPEMLRTYNWLKDLPDTSHLSNIVEVRFKGTRKEFFRNDDQIPVRIGDLVVVACSPGHDIGYVSLTGTLAKKQFDRKVKRHEQYTWNKIYRKATDVDTHKWETAKTREQPALVRSRQIASKLGLGMKIGDVEFRGDNAKAIFYYISDTRVDFRELIKKYAHEFHVKIEMKQIGARQEAGRIGGIGSCGRELCCSTWRTEFTSITSDAATKQGLSPNAGKMAGRCGKLKCCLVYELDTYLEAQENFPYELLTLETDKGIARHMKTEILNKKIWYTIDDNNASKQVLLKLDAVKDIIQLNKRGIRPSLEKYIEHTAKPANEMIVGSNELLQNTKQHVSSKNPLKISYKRRISSMRGKSQ